MTMRRRAAGAAVVAMVLTVGCSSAQRRSLASATTTTSTTATTSTSTTTTSTTTPTPSAPTTTAVPVLYRPVPAPTVGITRTDEFAVDGPLANGQYWVEYNGSDSAGVPYVSLYIAYFGEACVEAAVAFNDECYNDVYVTPTPTRDVETLPFAADSLIAVADARSLASYRIDAAELVAASTGMPSGSAPDGYAYFSYPFLMTVVDGEIVAFEQYRLS